MNYLDPDQLTQPCLDHVRPTRHKVHDKQGDKNMRKAVIAFSVAALLGACATTKTLQAVGGSRADGIVELAFSYGAFESPRVDMNAALQTAVQRCAVWGYSGAEPFGGSMQQCNASNAYGCVQTTVTVRYQCTGAGQPG